MPLYEYECQQCHRRTEKIQKFSDPELTECPHCGGKLERTITAPSFQFSGGGWYKDGYGSAKPAASGSGDSSPAGAPGSGDPAPATPTAAPSTPAPTAPSTAAKS